MQQNHVGSRSFLPVIAGKISVGASFSCSKKYWVLQHPTSWCLQNTCKYNFAVIESVFGFPSWVSTIKLCVMFVLLFLYLNKVIKLKKYLNIDSPAPY